MLRQKKIATKTNNEVKSLFKAGKRCAVVGDYALAIAKFAALLAIQPQHASAWFHKAKAHMQLDQLAEALVAYQEVTILSDELRGLANACIQDIKTLSLSATPEEEKVFYNHPSIIFRNEVCTALYLETFAKLIRDHQHIATLNFDQKLSCIITLIDFCEKYYTPHDGHLGFVRPEFVDKSDAGKLARLQRLGNPTAKLTLFNERQKRKYAVGADEPRRYAAMFEEDSCRAMRMIEDDLYLDDAMQILRMMFEVMHQFERDKRGELVGRLPWGKNSWYHLDFCSTFFRSNVKAGQVPILLDSHLSQEKLNQLIQFQLSIRYDLGLVKSIMPELLQVDLPLIREFFVAVKAGLGANDPLRMQDLPTLRPLLWHFKHSYQLLRLTATLPTEYSDDHDAASFFEREADIHKNRNDADLLVMTPIQLLLLSKFPPNFTQSLKLKLSILRRTGIIGEVFSKRNWGSQLDELDFMDPDIFTTIRNGFCHPEDLTSTRVIEAIENNDAEIVAIYQELVKFHTEIEEFIISRQMEMPYLVDISKMQYPEWGHLLRQYWLSVKNRYQMNDVLNGDDYCPKQVLLSPEKMQQILQLLRGSRAYNKLADMLNGVIPFSLPEKDEFDPEHELYPINKIVGLKLDANEKLANNENKKSLKVIDKLLSEANRKYASLKNDYLKRTKLGKEARDVALKGVRTAKMSMLPVLGKLAADMFSTFTNEAKNQLSMNQDDLLQFLQRRIKLLRQLICEIPYYAAGNTSVELLKSKVSTDPDLLYALIYLNTQVISVLNKMNSLHALSGISAELVLQVETYVQIRNALEHHDPVIDSLEDTYIQMISKSHMVLCEISLEFINQFYDVIMKATPHDLQQHQAADKPPAAVTKQRQAMTLSSGGNNSYFMAVDLSNFPRRGGVGNRDNENSEEVIRASRKI